MEIKEKLGDKSKVEGITEMIMGKEKTFYAITLTHIGDTGVVQDTKYSKRKLDEEC